MSVNFIATDGIKKNIQLNLKLSISHIKPSMNIELKIYFLRKGYRCLQRRKRDSIALLLHYLTSSICHVLNFYILMFVLVPAAFSN